MDGWIDVPVPFHNDESLSVLGTAAFLVIKVVSAEPYHCVGCVFLVNAIGEPLEFAFNRVELIPSALWNGVDLRRAAARRLVSSLFESVRLTPKLLFILSESFQNSPLESFDPLKFDIPTIAVTTTNSESSVPATVIWGSTPPNAEESRLYELIRTRGLLFEPFERAQTALKLVYRELASQI